MAKDKNGDEVQWNPSRKLPSIFRCCMSIWHLSVEQLLDRTPSLTLSTLRLPLDRRICRQVSWSLVTLSFAETTCHTELIFLIINSDILVISL